MLCAEGEWPLREIETRVQTLRSTIVKDQDSTVYVLSKMVQPGPGMESYAELNESKVREDDLECGAEQLQSDKITLTTLQVAGPD